MPKYKILKLKADKIIEYGTVMDEKNINKVPYNINFDENVMYEAIVEEQLLMDNCAMFDQLCFLLKKDDENEICDWISSEIVIVDFTSIYKEKSKITEEQVENLIKAGFCMNFHNKTVFMLPFDKSGNMSRKNRLSFINEEHLEQMNERLNLGMDFTKIPVKLSKYYAYRGLYLSTAKKISNPDIKITPETLIVVKDRLQEKAPYQLVKFPIKSEVGVTRNEQNTDRVTAEKINTPFDGQGVVCPDYAKYMNDSMGKKEIHSFQIRLPFAKGMLHSVDFHEFFKEWDKKYEEETYEIEDAFGRIRDLKKAHIIMTKSMFKCFDWLESYCVNDEDPMKFYCDALEKYQHALYVSSTDLPYGHSKLTHLSYQVLNTLALSEEQFQSLIDKQLGYIHNPISFIEMSKGQPVVVYSDDKDEEGKAIDYEFPNWQQALLVNPYFGHLKYIKRQLENMQTALMTQLVSGKITVKGQMRYMVRDLPYMLVNLITDKTVRESLKQLKVYHYRFYLPQGKAGENEMGLEYYTHCAFFRSPHLSRNEQSLLAPIVLRGESQETYRKQIDIFNKYFGHLTGIVVFGNESLVPMALGGADFDGDLVNMIMDGDVVNAVKTSVYISPGAGGSLSLERRSDTPYIKIPSIGAKEVTVPRTIPYEQIRDTFSNKIGLISNAAIAIGQSEYGTKKSENLDITCSDCTILTGLEIDAAKNGVHPDLSKIENKENLATCNYLAFMKSFENFRKRKNYHFNKLQLEKKNGAYVLSIKGDDSEIQYIEEDGTYINKLPIVFMNNLKPKLELPKVKNKKHFEFPMVEVSENKIEVFTEQCKKIIDTYLYYAKLFVYIKDKITKNEIYKLNLERLIKKQYDEENAEIIIQENLPKLYKRIVDKMGNYSALKKFQNEIQEQQWHMMTQEQKKCFLCKSFDMEEIDETEWAVVLQPYNHGYKTLWYIVKEMENILHPSYGELKKKFDKYHTVPEYLYGEISQEANSSLRGYVESKETFSIARLYEISISALRDMIQQFGIPTCKKIEILFQLTKDSETEAKFFWDCFTWEELVPYIVKENGDAE